MKGQIIMSFQRRLSAATTALIAVLFCTMFVSVTAPKTAIASSPSRKAVKTVENLPSKTDEDKIYSLVRISQPRKGVSFARRVASILVYEARKEKLPPLVCASVAYTESHFDQGAGPCVGIMQVHEASLREYIKKRQGDFKNLDPDVWTENLRIGVRELSLHKNKPRTLRGALGRYNGCGAGGSYVDRVMSVYSKLKRGSPGDWKEGLNRGHELWR